MVARLKSTGELVDGLRITLDMAKRRLTKNSSGARCPRRCCIVGAASAFGRFHIPDLILGIQSVEENEVIEAEVSVEPEPADSKAGQGCEPFGSQN